jgi:hypothetical protein
MICAANTQNFPDTSSDMIVVGRVLLFNVAKQKKSWQLNIKAAIHRHLDYLQRNLDAIDTQINSGAMLSGLKPHW